MIRTNIKFNNIFRAEPPIDLDTIFGSRLVKKDKHLYISAGERGQGMIAQDVYKHPGSIIRITLMDLFPKIILSLKIKKIGYLKFSNWSKKSSGHVIVSF